ncbi:MAG: SDR family NAD(P)-dependent oxidoreductase, partial [Nitrosopumilaceae archaeon]
MNYANKVVVVTGASSGIGEESAAEFARRRSSVVLVSRRKETLDDVAKKLTKYGSEILVCPCDVSQKQQVEQMSKTTLDKFGQIDILVNNAGFAIYG